MFKEWLVVTVSLGLTVSYASCERHDTSTPQDTSTWQDEPIKCKQLLVKSYEEVVDTWLVSEKKLPHLDNEEYIHTLAGFIC